jgi:hypothetical protein
MCTFIPSTNNHGNLLGSYTVAKKTAAHVDKEPSNMQHHVDHGIATTDCSHNYPSSLQHVTILDPKVANLSGRIEGKSNCVLLTTV